ncbi:hypothetical protein R1sor_011683 [Riccia sorocarpa]|uniref:Uncharacterized protein n=1 Tax=Riccia sorocarpa TaxID=122646 RepID=A0ABD3I1K8_9MARC
MSSSDAKTKGSSSKWSKFVKGSQVASSDSPPAAGEDAAANNPKKGNEEEKKKSGSKGSRQAIVVNYFPDRPPGPGTLQQPFCNSLSETDNSSIRADVPSTHESELGRIQVMYTTRIPRKNRPS